MDKVCPLCNKIIEKDFYCNDCKGIMVDKGRIQEYLGPYSADMPIENKEGYCSHVYQCMECNKLKSVNFKEINFYPPFF